MSASSKSQIKGFDKQYWDDNYYDPKSMDCIGNAKDHVRYLKSLFTLEYIDISSIIDLGAGLGHLFKEFNKSFLPYKSCAIEPSEYAFKKLSKKKLQAVESTKLSLYNEDLLTWCNEDRGKKTQFDLGLCTSVFQYISDKDLKTIIPILSKRVKNWPT